MVKKKKNQKFDAYKAKSSLVKNINGKFTSTFQSYSININLLQDLG